MRRKKKKQRLFQNSDFQTYSGTQELFDSEAGLTEYSKEIVSKFFCKMNLDDKIIKNKGTILEFGAGTGFLAEIFRNEFQIEPECVELDPTLMNLIKSKSFVSHQFLAETSQKYDAIYTSNVLEHIQDDSATLRELYDSLKIGGVIGIYVPAHPILYSAMDREIGHVRRYTRAELRSKVEAAGFSVQSLSYDEFLGFFASLIVKIIGYKNSIGLGSKRSLIIYDRIFYPLSRALDSLGFRFILGKNLILIATKPVGSNE